MGVKTFFEELKTKVSASRLFKALVSESSEVIPKVTTSVKSIEIVHGDTFGPGCIIQTNFPEGAHFKYIKNRIDEVDHEKHRVKYTLIEGDVLGEKLEKICYELQLEDTEDGCVLKATSEYHTKGDCELNEEEIKGAKDQALGMYKACEEYLLANPHVCA